MENLDVIIEIVQSTIAGKGTSVNRALIESGAGKDFIANMKKGRYPSINKFAALAEYLDVSIDCLVGRRRPD